MSQIEFNLFSDDIVQEPAFKEKDHVSNDTGLSISLINAILGLLTIGQSSAREICENLIEKHNAPRARYSTNKPKIYPKVCLFLDSLVIKGEVDFICDINKQDRKYKLVCLESPEKR